MPPGATAPNAPASYETLARRSAAGRLAALQPDIRSARQHPGEVIDQVEAVEAAAAALAALAREDDSGEQPPTGRSWFAAWSYAADHGPTSDDRGVLDAGAFATWYTAGDGAFTGLRRPSIDDMVWRPVLRRHPNESSGGIRRLATRGRRPDALGSPTTRWSHITSRLTALFW